MWKGNNKDFSIGGDVIIDLPHRYFDALKEKEELVFIALGSVIDSDETSITVAPNQTWLANPIRFSKRKSGKYIAVGYGYRNRMGPTISPLTF